MDKMPITQNWIEQIFEEQIDWDVDCPNACFVSGEFVNAIAAQHEQDVASLVAVRDMYAIEIEGLQAQVAQVAVMATAITDVLERRGRGDRWLGETLRVALSAAPKVVARLEGKALKRMDGSLLVMARHDDAIQIYHASDDRHYEGGYSTLGEPIEQVMVLVVECPPKGEQGYKRARGVIPWDEGGERPEDVIARLRGRPTESEQEATDG